MNNLSRSSPRFFAVLAALLVSFPVAHAAPFIVTTAVDGAPNSLRQAISATPAGGSIEFNIPTSDAGYNAATGIFTITLTGSELQIVRDLTITAPTNAKIAVSGNNTVRVFNILAGTVNISNLTIRNGRVFGTNGTNSVGNQPATAGTAAPPGGGIVNNGILTLRNCTLTQNASVGGAGGNGISTTSFTHGGASGAASGGAIFNAQTLTLIDCTLSGNVAQGGRGGDGADGATGAGGANSTGGALLNTGSVTLVNCTFSLNSAAGGNGGNSAALPGKPGAGGPGVGGAIAQSGAAPSCVVQNTILGGNNATGGSGGVNTTPNSGVPPGANGSSTGPDVAAAVTSQGHNLVGRTDGSTGWNGADFLGGVTDMTKLDPLLGALGDNGGPTYTMRPLPASATVDNGDDAVLSPPWSLTSDQRGFARKVGARVDIGAVELGLPQAGPAFTVNNTSADDDGSCTTDDCSLREALNATNANADANTITFAAGVTGRITNNIPAGLAITNPVAILGPGARVLTIHGGSGARLFDVASNDVSISGLTLAFGRANSGSGGAIWNRGKLVLSRCTLFANVASVHAGAIYNDGIGLNTTLTATDCTFLTNTSSFSGGAIFAAASNGATTTALTNCTFHTNGASQFGGAIYNDGTGSGNAAVTTTNCTFTENSAGSGGGGIVNDGVNPSSSGTATVTMRNTIFRTGGSGANLFNDGGTYISQGTNISNDAAGGPAGTAPGGFLNAAGDKRNTDPQLGAFGNNGGQTDTAALLNTSPAINAGNNSLAPLTDQRGYLRSNGSDIGAFEFTAQCRRPSRS
jgi:hypothetical protein